MSTSPGFDARAGHHFVAIDGAHNESCKIVLAVRIEAGHLRGFAADEHAGVGLAGIGKAADDALDHVFIELAGREVIQKEERVAPCTAMSFTQWLTRSAPTVWCRPSSNATLSLVPTPSAELTRMGFFQRCMSSR